MKKQLKLFQFFIFTPLFFAAAFTLSCGNNQSSSVEREDLFTIEIGHMEDQLALYKLDGTGGTGRASFTMRDGLFYIADGNSGKISRFNSYGDLLFMIYNEETNPAPISLKTNIQGDEQTTLWAYPYPLESPGVITVDSRKHIFVEERLPPQECRTDIETNAYLDGIILQFDEDGRFINYLGQEGIGGSPFPRIIGLTASINDELAVICRLPGGWHIYWYNSSGTLLFLVKIDADSIPALQDLPDAVSVVDTIAAAIDARKLFIKIDYSRDTFDPSTNTRTGFQPVTSVIWTLDTESGAYTNSFEIPTFELNENERTSSVKVFYSMLGVTRGGKALLYFPVETGLSILFVDTSSREYRRSFLNFTNDELQYNYFYLSPEGILSAMLADTEKVKMICWRTDKFIGGLM